MLSLRKVAARWKVVTWKTYTEEQNYNSRETNFEKNDAFKFSAVMVGFKVDSSDRNTYVQPDASIKIAVGLITNSFGERSLEEGTLIRRNQPKHSSRKSRNLIR